jgi:hypothetical protein
MVYVSTLPDCAFCGQPACYDAQTKNGQWAYVCEQCVGAQCDTGLRTELRVNKNNNSGCTVKCCLVIEDDCLVATCPLCQAEKKFEIDSDVDEYQCSCKATVQVEGGWL